MLLVPCGFCSKYKRKLWQFGHFLVFSQWACYSSSDKSVTICTVFMAGMFLSNYGSLTICQCLYSSYGWLSEVPLVCHRHNSANPIAVLEKISIIITAVIRHTKATQLIRSKLEGFHIKTLLCNILQRIIVWKIQYFHKRRLSEMRRQTLNTHKKQQISCCYTVV